MSTEPSSIETLLKRLSDGAFLQKAWTDIKMAYWLMKQPDVPIISKVIPILAAAYVISPIDFVPDVVPVLGQMDDVAIIMLGVRTFLHMAPPAVTGRYEAEMAGGTIVEGEAEPLGDA